MRIAILGAKGVIGGYLNQALRSKYNVTGITREQLDLLNYSQVIKYFNNNPFDVIINCAVNADNRLDAPPKVASDILALFNNLYSSRKNFGRVIHFCSGAEFDCRFDITNASEDCLFTSRPVDPYGMSKNATANISFATEEFYNLRLFGVFYPTEIRRRLLPKILSGEPVTLIDKYFDYIYLEDILPVVEYYVNSKQPIYKDINLVYPEKLLISEFVERFCKIKKLSNHNISLSTERGNNYTGDSSKFESLNLFKYGIDQGFSKY